MILYTSEYIEHSIQKNHLTYIYLTTSDENSDTDSDIDDTDDATVMGSSVAYAEVEASIRALRYGSVEGNQGEYCVVERYGWEIVNVCECV